MSDAAARPRPRAAIAYCTKCRFLARACWLAQGLLTTFADEIGEIALVPGEGGVFQVRVGEELVACRARDGGFPELADLKRRVRDRVAPDRDLGHSEPA